VSDNTLNEDSATILEALILKACISLTAEILWAVMFVAAKKGVVTLMSAFKISISPSMEVIRLDTITGE